MTVPRDKKGKLTKKWKANRIKNIQKAEKNDNVTCAEALDFLTDSDSDCETETTTTNSDSHRELIAQDDSDCYCEPATTTNSASYTEQTAQELNENDSDCDIVQDDNDSDCEIAQDDNDSDCEIAQDDSDSDCEPASTTTNSDSHTEQIVKLDGARIIDFSYVVKLLTDGCILCGTELSITRVTAERRKGLASIWHISCGYCKHITKVHTSKYHTPVGHDNRSLVHDLNNKAAAGKNYTYTTFL